MAQKAQAIVSLADLKAYIGAQGTSEDPNLEAAIDRATAWLEGQANRHFVTRGSVTEYHTLWDGRRSLELSQRPTIAVASIHESTSTPPVYDATTLLTEGTDYQVVKELGLVRRVSSGALYPWTSGYRAIKVVHSYGYQDINDQPAAAEPLPDDLKMLCLFVSAAIFKEADRARWGISSVTDAQGSVTRFLGYLPPDMKDALKSYKRYVFDRTWEAA